ncbi:Fibroblast growth factor receptor 1 [Holothuria leucospilota]|uniref:Fibroblast growth factor receptor 1 n=1 Tax=Holothuria leucospilota TaxID=206669 RepID=A0A9Q1BYU8_HOLLE|nr:Fibroblast growth factor receptor 1 [Holothuria leucospilota]
MDKLETFLVILWLLILGNTSHPTAKVIQCTSIVTQPYASCSIGYNDSVCLVCSISITEPGLTWEYVNSLRHLFRDGSAVYENETDKLGINKCHPTNYSLEISPASIRYKRELSCSQRKVALTKFAVRREVPVKMIVLQNQTDVLSGLITEEGRNISLQCLVVDGLSPIHLKWTVNGKEEHTESFTSLKRKGLQNFTSLFTFIVTPNDRSVSCSVQGSYTRNQTVLINITHNRNELLSLLPLFPQHVRNIFLGSLVVIMFVVMLTTIFCKRKRSRRLSSRRVSPPQPPLEVRRAVQSFFEDRGDETESNIFEAGGIQTMDLLSTSGKMKRWTARRKDESSHRVTCIAITLPEDSGPKDWCEFRMFVAYLKLIPKHKHIASILGTNTDTVPYQIIQEYVSNGSFKDFLKDQYSKIYTKSMQERSMDSDAYMTNLTQVLQICSNVIDALIFLGKHDLVHPGICSRKVLMDDRMTCKLYDCHHRYIIEREMPGFVNKVSAPLEWLAPETLTDYQYHSKSDVWSVGVFLWEVLSLGKTPYNNMNLERLKLAVKTTPPLPEPGYKCEETYLLMKGCWELDAEKRPTLDLVLEDLHYILSDLDLYETQNYEVMF